MLALFMAFFLGTVAVDFPGGSAGSVEWVTESHLRVGVEGQADQDGRNRQASWYFFRVDDFPQREIRIEFTHLLGEYNYRPGVHAVNAQTHPVFSYDGTTWTHFPAVEWDDEQKHLNVHFRPERASFWIAHTPPHTETQLNALEAGHAAHPMFQRETVGKSVEGRAIPLWTITDRTIPMARKKVIWLMFRQHAWESWTSWVGDGAIRFLLSDDAEAEVLRREVVWKIFPVADPDGVFHGGVRYNRNGYDLNRNWDALDPVKMPENAAQHGAIQRWIEAGNRVDWFLTLHNTETGEYLEGPAAHHERINQLREILLSESTFNPTRERLRDAGASTAPGMKGRMSVNQGLFAEFGIPAMLMEQMIARNSKLGGFPTIEQRRTFGRDLVKAMAKSLR
ncbi:MAG: hypothetical protein KIT83_20825 [Bryobacterales bacterium]|nr:hypothetical protein [Bryobacterales bacterium]